MILICFEWRDTENQHFFFFVQTTEKSRQRDQIVRRSVTDGTQSAITLKQVREEIKSLCQAPGKTFCLKGEQGEVGVPGVAGKRGLPGAPGDKGDMGDKGETGYPGPSGSPGIKGDDGLIGAKGADGQKGEAGVKGDKGCTGATGSKGDTGAQGDDGWSGSTGPKGKVLNSYDEPIQTELPVTQKLTRPQTSLAMSTSWRAGCEGKEKSEEKRDFLSLFSLSITSCYRRVRYAQRLLSRDEADLEKFNLRRNMSKTCFHYLKLKARVIGQ